MIAFGLLALFFFLLSSFNGPQKLVETSSQSDALSAAFDLVAITLFTGSTHLTKTSMEVLKESIVIANFQSTVARILVLLFVMELLEVYVILIYCCSNKGVVGQECLDMLLMIGVRF